MTKISLPYLTKEFLSRKGFVHRDLAARNVLVCEGKLVKVADFGLSRNVYAGRMYHSTKTRKLPIKWMSPEAIHDQVFTAESDAYVYKHHDKGVVLNKTPSCVVILFQNIKFAFKAF